MFIKKSIIILVLSVYGIHAMDVRRGQEISSIVEKMPINAMVEPKVQVIVEIPENFKSDQSMEDLLKGPMNEYFPKTDKDVKNWTELITTHNHPGMGVTSKFLAGAIIKGITGSATNINILRNEQKDERNYCSSIFAIAYNFKNRREILFGHYLSGPLDCSGFQYAIALSDKMTEEAAFQKIKDYADKKVKLLK